MFPAPPNKTFRVCNQGLLAFELHSSGSNLLLSNKGRILTTKAQRHKRGDCIRVLRVFVVQNESFKNEMRYSQQAESSAIRFSYNSRSFYRMATRACTHSSCQFVSR